MANGGANNNGNKNVLSFYFTYFCFRFQTAVLESEIIAIGEAFTIAFSTIHYSEKLLTTNF